MESNQATLTCEQCGKEMEPKKGKKYCSKKCGIQKWKLEHPKRVRELDRKWKLEHSERLREENRVRYQKTPRVIILERNRNRRREKPERCRERRQALGRNKERSRAHWRAYYWRNPERNKERTRAWQRKNPERWREIARRNNRRNDPKVLEGVYEKLLEIWSIEETGNGGFRFRE